MIALTFSCAGELGRKRETQSNNNLVKKNRSTNNRSANSSSSTNATIKRATQSTSANTTYVPSEILVLKTLKAFPTAEGDSVHNVATQMWNGYDNKKSDNLFVYNLSILKSHRLPNFQGMDQVRGVIINNYVYGWNSRSTALQTASKGDIENNLYQESTLRGNHSKKQVFDLAIDKDDAMEKQYKDYAIHYNEKNR